MLNSSILHQLQYFAADRVLYDNACQLLAIEWNAAVKTVVDAVHKTFEEINHFVTDDSALQINTDHRRRNTRDTETFVYGIYDAAGDRKFSLHIEGRDPKSVTIELIKQDGDSADSCFVESNLDAFLERMALTIARTATLKPEYQPTFEQARTLRTGELPSYRPR